MPPAQTFGLVVHWFVASTHVLESYIWMGRGIYMNNPWQTHKCRRSALVCGIHACAWVTYMNETVIYMNEACA